MFFLLYDPEVRYVSADTVNLKFYQHEDLEALRLFQLPAEQEQFTALPIHRASTASSSFTA